MTDCREVAMLLASRALGVLEADEGAALEAHLSGCSNCPSLASDLDVALAKPALAAPPSSWERLERALEAERRGPEPRVVLSCTFCHGELRRDEASYCAACLAPHHQDCFAQHGRCATAGCGETRTVRPALASPPAAPPRRPPLIAALVGIALGAGLAAGAAALGSRNLPPDPSPPSPAAPSPVAPLASSVPPPPPTPPSPVRKPAMEIAWDQAASKVAPQDKLRYVVHATKDAASGALTLHVSGAAFYPDGVSLLVGLRHVKVKTPFLKQRVLVRERRFAHSLVVPRTLPGGNLTVEVWFLLSAQTEQVRSTLLADRWFTTTPPTARDQTNAVLETFDPSEAEERDHVERARVAIMEAHRAARDAYATEHTPIVRGGIFGQLDERIDVARHEFNDWTKTRQLLLFPSQATKLKGLVDLIRDDARAIASDTDTDEQAEARAAMISQLDRSIAEFTGEGVEVEALAAGERAELHPQR